MSWLRPLSAALHYSARRSREHRTRTQQQARNDRAVREYERRHRNCLDQHGEACETQDCTGRDH